MWQNFHLFVMKSHYVMLTHIILDKISYLYGSSKMKFSRLCFMRSPAPLRLCDLIPTVSSRSDGGGTEPELNLV